MPAAAGNPAPVLNPLFEDHHARFNLYPRRWDFVLTCYEPLSMVTGGIGTYARLLLRLLSLGGDSRAILLICSAELESRLREALPNISLIVAPPIHHRHGLHIEDVGNEHMRFSLAVAETLWSLQNHGHSFALIEFPDYGMEGYFTLKMRRHGQLRLDRIAVRLHSPLLMLFDDNNDPLHEIDVIRRRSLAHEVYCYRHADVLLYGADAMLRRVEAICRRQGLEIAPRAVKIAHPMAEGGIFGLESAPPPEPAPRPADRPLTLCYVGRLENRKGIAHFFETVTASPRIVELIREANLQFQLLGLDLPHDDKRSNGDLIRASAERSGLTAHISIFGYIDQQKLPAEYLVHADAFLFPSIFENYPNALLETLPFGKPTLVSARGGMPEVAAPFGVATSYDPLDPSAEEAIFAFLSGLRPTQADPGARERFDAAARESNARMLADYFALAQAPGAPAPAAPAPDFAVAFVVPHYNSTVDLADCLGSIRACARANDEIIVVDDQSRPEEVERLQKIIARENAACADQAVAPAIQLVLLPRNGGPSAARNAGAAAIKAAGAIQFLDADDMLDATGFRAARAALRLNPDLDMIYGILHSFGERSHYWFTNDSNPLTVLDENFSHSAILVRKTVFDQLGGFAAALRHLFEDWEFNARFCFAGFVGEGIVAPTLRNRVLPASRSTDNADRLFNARQDLLAHLARCEKVSGDPHADRLVAAIAGHVSVLVKHGLISRAALQDPDHFKKTQPIVRERRVIEEIVHVTQDNTVRNLREQIKASGLSRWRRQTASWLLSLTKKLGRLPV